MTDGAGLGVETSATFNENADNPFIVQMRLWHLARYFQVAKLDKLITEAMHEHTESLGEQLCRVPTSEHPEPFKVASVQLFAAIEELYGKYYQHGQYSGHAHSVKGTFKPELMRLLMCNVHEVAQVPSFKALLHKYFVFAADWAFVLTEVAGRRKSANLKHHSLACDYCNAEVEEDADYENFSVKTISWIQDGETEVTCGECFRLPTLDEFKAS